MSDSRNAIVVLVAAGSAEEASMLAREAVGRKLAACAQYFPMRSCYEWQGEIVEDAEYMLLLKSRQAAYDALEACLVELHSYEVPEVLVFPVAGGLPAYLGWLAGIVMTP